MAFIRHLPLTLMLLLIAGKSLAAGNVIGVVAPVDGNFALLGKQFLDGAAVRAEMAGDTIVAVAETCEEGNGAAVAGQFVAAKVSAAIGFLCSETLESALPALKEAQIPAITLSVRSGILMDDARKSGWLLYRMAPADGAEAARIIEIILADWQATPFAIIEDGTIQGRELTERVRNGLEERGLKPVFTDTFRPGQEQQIALVRRLARAGADHVFIGGDRSDVAVMARDATMEGIALRWLGGDGMNAANQPVALIEGVRAVTIPDPALLPANADLVKAFRARGIEPEGYVLPAYAAFQIASDAADARAENKPVAESLQKKAYETAVGPVRFNDAHELTDNPYRLLEWRGNAFVPPQPNGK